MFNLKWEIMRWITDQWEDDLLRGCEIYFIITVYEIRRARSLAIADRYLFCLHTISLVRCNCTMWFVRFIIVRFVLSGVCDKIKRDEKKTTIKFAPIRMIRASRERSYLEILIAISFRQLDPTCIYQPINFEAKIVSLEETHAWRITTITQTYAVIVYVSFKKMFFNNCVSVITFSELRSLDRSSTRASQKSLHAVVNLSISAIPCR